MDGQIPNPPNVGQTQQTPSVSLNETPDGEIATSTLGKAAEASLQKVG